MMNITEEIPEVNYMYVFPFENDYNFDRTQVWMVKHWKHCVHAAILYVIIIFGGQQWMKSRPKFELRRPLVFWNFTMALFSITGALRTLPEMLYVLQEYGFYHSVCNTSYVDSTRVSGFWTWMFILSKIPELGDTVFIVLRKQPLIFLHWYHHITVMLYCWYSYINRIASGRWFVVMNYSVHSFMYSYYAMKASGIRIPRKVSMLITVAQLAQMVGGCYVNTYGYQAKVAGRRCDITDDNIKVSLIMYGSYFVLFSHFFFNAYMKRKIVTKPHTTKCD